MRYPLRTLAAATLVGAAAFYAGAASGDDGWITLLDSTNKGEWTEVGKANWEFKDGAMVADKLDGKELSYLVTKNSYKDFQIRAEFWVDGPANSGVFIRCSDPLKVTATNAYEVNIFDARPDPSYGTGAIVNVAKVNPMPKAANKWNTYEITANGRVFTVTLNGQRTVDGAENGQHALGRIALQYGAGVVKFRLVQIKPI